MEPHDFTKLGGLPRVPDTRDHLIGSATGSYTFPAAFSQGTAWNAAPIYYQGQQPACGAHAGDWLKVLLDINDGIQNVNKTPRYVWANIKRDGTSPDDGTTMQRIFSVLQNYGVDDFEPLENDVTVTTAAYASAAPITASMTANGQGDTVSSYAYLTDRSFSGLKQAISDHKAVILLMDVGASMWTAADGTTSWAEKDVLPLRPPNPIVDGHFVVAHSYDENYIYFANSWGNTWGRNGHGYFGADYIPYILEAGVAQNAPLTTTVLQTRQISLLEKVKDLLESELQIKPAT